MGRMPTDDPTSLHLDFVDGVNISENEFTPRFEGEGRSRKDHKDELKLLRRERKEIALKQAELRETMLRMEVQMHDYKETKQENDILTKDIQLMKKDLREVTLGAAKACEANENLRKDVTKLKQLVRQLGGDPRDINLTTIYDSESASDSLGHSGPKEISYKAPVPPKVPSISPAISKRIRSESKTEASDSEDGYLLPVSPRGITKNGKQDSKPINRNVRERVARMEDLLSSLRGVCISISNTPPNVSIFFTH